MKTIVKSILILAVAIVATSFTNNIANKIKIKDSTIEWKGKKVFGSHTGTISLKDGYLEMDGETLIGGMFVVDMTSINVTDLKAGDGKEKLEGHLKSDDFFGTENHPTATLTFTNVELTKGTYTVTGDLTIKETTEPITFDLKVDAGKATTSLKIDRTKFGVRYGSGNFFDSLGDNTISDKFELDVTLKF